jgi:hypothetical protein
MVCAEHSKPTAPQTILPNEDCNRLLRILPAALALTAAGFQIALLNPARLPASLPEFAPMRFLSLYQDIP